MQITLDIKNMNALEREHLAGFIMTYPQAEPIKVPGTSKERVVELTNEITQLLNEDVIDPEMQILQHDQESTLPELAFGAPAVDAAAQAFGAATPLVAPATHAPVGADAGQSQTAPVVAPPPPVTTSTVQAADQPPIAPTVVAPSAPANTVELDKQNLPWDHRIHSESRTKVADGSWRKKRGCDPTLIATVEAELRAVMGAPAVTTAPAVPESHIDFTPPVATSTPPPVPGAADNDALKQQYIGLTSRISAAIAGKRVTLAAVTEICVQHGVPALPLLINRLDLVPTVAAAVDAIIQSAQP